MSRIFDALKRLEQETGGPLVPGLSGVELELERQQQVPHAPAEPEEAVAAPAQAAVNLEPASAPLGRTWVRTLPLRVPGSAPVLPYDGKARDKRVSERYRIIRTKLLQHPLRPRMIVVSSPGPGDGKSVTAVNLAGALSLKATADVLLMDADFRRATIHEQTGLPNEPGLAGVLEQGCALEEALIHTEQFPHLYVLPAGKGSANPAELLGSPQWHQLCAQLRAMFEYIIVDSPPIAAVADYDLIQASCDGVILVARPDHTKRTACLKALQAIPKTKLIGVVVNCVEDWFLTRALEYDAYYAQRYGGE